MLHKDLKFITDCICSQSISWCEPFVCETKMHLWKKRSWSNCMLFCISVVMKSYCISLLINHCVISILLEELICTYQISTCLRHINLMYLTSSENVYCPESVNTYENWDRLNFGTGCYNSIQKYISCHIVPKQLKIE